MVSKKVVINNPTGLHLRPAGIFCNTAVQFDCKVTFHGTSADSIDMAEDRERFDALLEKLDIKRPKGDTVTTTEEALAAMVKAIEDGLGE